MMTPTDCEMCHGTGKIDPPFQCAACGGTGKVLNSDVSIKLIP